VSGQLYAEGAFTKQKELIVPIEQEAGVDPELIWARWRREKSLFPAKS